jgi:purine nucleoside phosphorylase
LKSSEKVKIAIIGGTGFEKLFKSSKSLRVKTLYGTPRVLLIGTFADRRVAFLPRHGPNHSVTPHRITYKANIDALHKMCYATICYVSNMATGMQQRLSALEVSKIPKKILPVIEEILIGAIKDLPFKRGDCCSCSGALENARF